MLFVIEEKSLKNIKSALIKKASGYTTDEIVEEYCVDEGKEIMVKKKITKKYIPADLTAVKMLLDYYKSDSVDYSGMSDADLDKEAVKLFKEYQQLSSIDLCEALKGEVSDNK